MSDDQPYFRFNPGAYDEGRSLRRSDEICDVCLSPCVWKYSGNIYAEKSPTVCARCIASGALGQFLNTDSFALHDITLEDAEPELELEVLQRTPGISCFNPFEWPVLDGKPLAFAGYGEDKILIEDPDAQSAIKAAFDAIGWDFVVSTPTPYALVFKDVDGERYRAAIDLD